MRTALSIGLMALALSACAGSGSASRYAADLESLDQSCRERGGILTPTGGDTGRPQTDHVCRITGESSPRLPR